MTGNMLLVLLLITREQWTSACSCRIPALFVNLRSSILRRRCILPRTVSPET